MHSDFNAKNVLVDPATLDVTGLLDWEFAHAGSPYSDLGNLLRFDREPAFADAVLAAPELRAGPAPDAPRPGPRSDLFALVDLAAREARTRWSKLPGTGSQPSHAAGTCTPWVEIWQICLGRRI